MKYNQRVKHERRAIRLVNEHVGEELPMLNGLSRKAVSAWWERIKDEPNMNSEALSRLVDTLERISDELRLKTGRSVSLVSNGSGCEETEVAELFDILKVELKGL